MKAIVYTVFLFETVQTILITHDAFHQLATSFGNYEGLLDPYYIWFDLPVQSAICEWLIDSSCDIFPHINAPHVSEQCDAMFLCLAYTCPQWLTGTCGSHCYGDIANVCTSKPADITQLSLVQFVGGIIEGVAIFRYNSTSAHLPVEDKSVAVSLLPFPSFFVSLKFCWRCRCGLVAAQPATLQSQYSWSIMCVKL